MKRILLTIVLLAVSTLPVRVVALTVMDYAKLEQISNIALSPSGSRIAYQQVNNNKPMIVVYDFLEKKIVSRIGATEVRADSIKFVDDNRLLLDATTTQRIGGLTGLYESSTVFLLNLITNESIQLLRAGHGIYDFTLNLGHIISISQDTKYAYMLAQKTRTDYSLVKVSLIKSKGPSTYKKGKADVIDYFMLPSGKVLARERYNNSTNRHLVEAYHDNKWVKIYEKTTEIRRVGFSGITPDGKNLVMRRQDPAHGNFALYTMSLADGSISEPIFSRQDSEVEALISDTNKIVYGVRYSGFKPSYDFFDSKTNNTVRSLMNVFPEHSVHIASHTPDWSTIIIKITGHDSSGQYYRYSQGKLRPLAKQRSAITSEHVNAVSITQYQARDGLTIPTLLTLPKHQNSNLPAIVLPHGGPESYDRFEFDWLAQYFANQGYAVIQPQFRGSTGFGIDHQFKGRGQWGKKMQDDVTDAISAFAKQGIIDEDQVCIVGASYGGYSALAGAAYTPSSYRCAVSINGVSDIELMMSQEKMDFGYNHWVVSYWQEVIKNMKLDDDHLYNISPINFVNNITAPVLLIHGQNDLVVKISQSRNMRNAMKSANKQVTYVELPEGDHYLSQSKNRALALQAIADFVMKHLPPKATSTVSVQ